MSASLENAGIAVDSLAAALAEYDAAFTAEFGSGPDGIDLSADSYTGRQNNILAAREVQLQQLAAVVLNTLNLNNAQARQLDALGTLLATPRTAADAATITARLYGTPGFDAGDRRVRYRRNDTIWRIPKGTTIEANGQVQASLVADITGSTTTDGRKIEAYLDGSSQWVVVDTNPNLTAVESIADYSPGSDVEGDPSYRARLRVAGRGVGKATEPGVLRALQAVAGPTATIDNNRDLLTNANGVPGKSIEALVEDGTDEDVAQVLFDTVDSTTGFFGTTGAFAYDEDGNAVPIRFTRIARIDIEWEVTIDTAGAEKTLPDDAIALTQAALAAYTNDQLSTGVDVLPSEGAAAVRSALPKGSIPEGQLTLLVGLKGLPLAASPVTITSRQRARTNPSPQSAELVGTEVQPFNIIVGQQLDVAVDGGSVQSIVFQIGDFQVVSAATTLELVKAINTRLTGVVAGTLNGALTLASARTGSGSEIAILPTSSAALLAELGLTFGSVTGSNGDIEVTVL